jgi:hypothetical protein
MTYSRSVPSSSRSARRGAAGPPPGAFHFSGKTHTVTDGVIYNQARDFAVQKGAEVTKERGVWQK